MSAPATEYPAPRLKTRYREEIAPALQQQFDFGTSKSLQFYECKVMRRRSHTITFSHEMEILRGW
jgi:hypothetical protein